MKIGLFFGSFNPVHVGHLIIAHHMAQYADLEQVWLVVTPQNPLKPKNSLAPDYDRLHLVHLAVMDEPLLKVCDVEFKLPKPSYTYDTLVHLRERYPQHEFALIMGGDNLATLHKWRNYERIVAEYALYVYRRPNYELGALGVLPSVHVLDAPMMGYFFYLYTEGYPVGQVGSVLGSRCGTRCSSVVEYVSVSEYK
jgi:nicotinate-nucleotide adenylyltransferase